jgi:tRNA dimethylallyltransferase
MSSSSDISTPVIVAGPTAAGKSEAALLLAERTGGEIISVDSMQVYRKLDIGTAKPSAEERSRVPHHLIDVVELTDPFDASRFLDLAKKAVTEIQSRGHVPILCGGTGLYFKAFLEGLAELPATDPALRAVLEATPLEELLAELHARDPETYEAVDRKNPRRVIRAVEVIRITGKPYSAQRAVWKETATASSQPWFGFCRESEDLRRRIDARVDRMFRKGLVAETEALLKAGLEQNRNAMQALGYRQVVEHLRGEHSLAETIELVKSRTRKFAKRQMTWFRRQLALNWIELQPGQAMAEVVRKMAK